MDAYQNMAWFCLSILRRQTDDVVVRKTGYMPRMREMAGRERLREVICKYPQSYRDVEVWVEEVAVEVAVEVPVVIGLSVP